jgi:hypothetical protein
MRFQVVTTASLKMTVLGMLRHVVWQKVTDVSEVLPASIIRAISLNRRSKRNIPQYSQNYECRCSFQ